MTRRLLPLLTAVLLLVAVIAPCRVVAEAVNVTAEASLTLHYEQNGLAFAGLAVDIYRVAEAHEDGSFTLVEPFASYPVNIHGIQKQEQWQTAADTMAAYLVDNGQPPHHTKQTDQHGTVQFAHLQTGLYFVREAVATHADGTYLFRHFFVYLPSPLEDGSHNYHVEARPKCAKFEPAAQYTVTKLWQDDEGENRPAQVTVAIYKDGALWETQTLHADNHWTYTWSVSADDLSRWSVAERDVADGYTVTIRQNGNVFSLVNSRSTPPVPPPDTGETSHTLPWVLALCLSGLVLVLLSLYGRKRP